MTAELDVVYLVMLLITTRMTLSAQACCNE